MSLGLKRGTVRLVDHDPAWAAIYEEEKRLLSRLLGAAIVEIAHVGSTAVPGLCAKPLIDIAVAVAASEPVETWAGSLRKEGYTYFGEREIKGDRFFAKGPDESRTIYLHVVLSGSQNWRNYLSFRNRLRADDSLRRAYASLKEKLAQATPEERQIYSQGKADFIEAVLRSDVDTA